MSTRLKPLAKGLVVTAASLLIVTGTIALVAYGQGYSYDYERGVIVRNGLIVIDSTPPGAEIFLDGESAGTTNERLRVPADRYHMELFQDGYRSWSKRFSVGENQVLQVEYPLLLPNSVPTRPQLNLGDITVSALDSTQHRAAFVTADRPDRVRLLDDEFAGLPPIVYMLPGVESGNRIGELAWSPDGTRLLVTIHDAQARPVDFAIIDPGQETEPIVLSEQFEMPLRELQFDERTSALYGISGDRLYRLPMDGTAAPVVETPVSAYTVSDGVVYAALGREEQTLIARFDGGDVEPLHSYPTARRVELEAITRQDNTRLLVHEPTRRQITLLRQLDTSPKTRTLPLNAAAAYSISPNQRYILMRSGTQFYTYDLDLRRLHAFNRPEAAGMPAWYGSHHLLGVFEDELTLMEFDGGNPEYITRADSRFVFGDPQNDALYSLRQSQRVDRLQLQRSSLR